LAFIQQNPTPRKEEPKSDVITYELGPVVAEDGKVH
jgi:hypothetical protein